MLKCWEKITFIKGSIAGFIMMFVNVPIVQAADKTLFFRDLKQTFNSPLSTKISPGAIIFIAAALIFLWLGILLDTARTEKKQRLSQKAYQERKRMQLASRQQKRNWFRVKTNAEILWEPLGKSDISEEEEFQKDKLIDVSGGGLCFATEVNLGLDDKIRVLLPISNKQSLFLNGQVVRVIEKDERNLVSIKFLDIRESQRDKIIAALINIQRNAIKEEKDGEFNQDRESSSSA